MTYPESIHQRDDVENWIREARIRTEPSRVRRSHIPRWLSKRLTPHRQPQDYYSAHETLCRLAGTLRIGTGNWLDHWGSTVIDERPCFVSEPYGLNATDIAQVAQFAEMLNLDWYVSALSWWYPGSTVRIVFSEPKSAVEGVA